MSRRPSAMISWSLYHCNRIDQARSYQLSHRLSDRMYTWIGLQPLWDRATAVADCDYNHGCDTSVTMGVTRTPCSGSVCVCVCEQWIGMVVPDEWCTEATVILKSFGVTHLLYLTGLNPVSLKIFFWPYPWDHSVKMATCDGVNVQLVVRSTAQPNPNFISGNRINTRRSTLHL